MGMKRITMMVTLKHQGLELQNSIRGGFHGEKGTPYRARPITRTTHKRTIDPTVSESRPGRDESQPQMESQFPHRQKPVQLKQPQRQRTASDLDSWHGRRRIIRGRQSTVCNGGCRRSSRVESASTTTKKKLGTSFFTLWANSKIHQRPQRNAS
jgi:hypothetical protein